MISPYIMLAIGAVLFALEFTLFSFYLLFFGLAFIIVGAVNFGIAFEWPYQILGVAALAIVLLALLKAPLKSKFMARKESFNEEFLDEAGVGEIRENMVYFKGTLWKYDGALKNGEKVQVLGTKGDKVILK
ncbi:NfeD family protein [Campylobacter concisus]|uniref:NfeD family protein n=1 Tax=Campylobacter concisus TaxID=199 RepID=UPI000D3A9F7C|nr:nodulation protein NfeD [Campylobacter concisus]QPH93308.1 nodulation protein NfeD [Campylobacter concisus]